MVALELAGVPVAGEAGVDYVLDEGSDLPPLMFTNDELEAIIPGSRMVEARGGAGLVRAARDVFAEAAAVIPESRRHLLFDSTLFALRSADGESNEVDMSVIRDAIRPATRIRIAYCDERGRETDRAVWPDRIRLLAHLERSGVLV